MIVQRAWKDRVQIMIRQLRDSLYNLNLFQSSLRRELSDFKLQQWITRIYILLLGLALTVLMFYGLLNIEIRTIHVNKPTFKIVQQLQLQNDINSSLQCPCTQLTIYYGEFIQLYPYYHQVCSSAFVSNSWFNFFKVMSDAFSKLHHSAYSPSLSFHWSSSIFQLLTTLCNFVNTTVAHSLQTFEQKQFVSAQLLAIDHFESQMFAAIEQFQLETTNSFLQFIQLMRNITYVNQIISGSSGASAMVVITSPNFDIFMEFTTFENSDDNSSNLCSCANDISCHQQWGLFNSPFADTPIYFVPNLYSACFPIESLLQSTLECFYDNKDCLTIIMKFYNLTSLDSFTRLNSSSHASRFMINTTVRSLLSAMFIESWNQSINYSSYFTQCQPLSCSYQVSQHNSLLETVIRIIGLIGGLSVSLRILVPFLVLLCAKIIRSQWWSHHRQTPGQPSKNLFILQRFLTNEFLDTCFVRLVTFGTNIRDWFMKLNVFDDANRTSNIEQQLQGTRIYLFLLFISLFLLSIHTSLNYHTNTFTITKPSFQQYQQLQQSYGSDSVNCPCSQLSIPYSSFIQLKCNLHPVCTSQFISDLYLQQLFQIYSMLDVVDTRINAFTLQGTIFSHFQVLLTLCNLAKDALFNAQQQFLASSFVSGSMIGFDTFDKETNVSITNFQSTLPNSFLYSLQAIRGMIQSNGLISAYSTNWYPIIYDIFLGGLIYFAPQYYDNGQCSCATSSACTQPSIPLIPGYFVGCTPLEFTLRSTTECLYEQSCIQLLTDYLNISFSVYLAPLNRSQTRFSSNDTINTIVQQMFIETCSSNISYGQFFEQCQPRSCIVTLIQRNNFVILITTILGLYGGLTTILKLVVPFFVFFIYKLIRKYNQRARIGIQQVNIY